MRHFCGFNNSITSEARSCQQKSEGKKSSWYCIVSYQLLSKHKRVNSAVEFKVTNEKDDKFE